MYIGKFLKYLRKKNKITQRALSEKTGLAITTIQVIEYDKVQPKTENIQKIAQAFNYEANIFVDEMIEFYNNSNDNLENFKSGYKIMEDFIKEMYIDSEFNKLYSKKASSILKIINRFSIDKTFQEYGNEKIFDGFKITDNITKKEYFFLDNTFLESDIVDIYSRLYIELEFFIFQFFQNLQFKSDYNKIFLRNKKQILDYLNTEENKQNEIE